MKLSQLLETHHRSKIPGSIADHFGDAYLLNHNRIYKAIRRKTLELNFTFSNEKDDDYIALPLAQLDRILKQRKIPYINNVSAIEDICRKWSQVSWDDIQIQFKRNYLFHESCHAVASSQAPSVEDEGERILIRLLEESFANTCELLGMLDVHDKSHRCFYEMVSYILIFEKKSELQKLMKDIGWENLFRWMILSYLIINFRGKNISEVDFENMLKITFQGSINQISGAQKKALRGAAKIALDLNPDFIEVTTDLFLRTSGFSDPDSFFQKTNPLSLLHSKPQSLNFINKLIHVFQDSLQ